MPPIARPSIFRRCPGSALWTTEEIIPNVEWFCFEVCCCRDIGHGQRKSRSLEEALLDFFLPSADAALFAKLQAGWKSGSGCSGVIHWWDTNMPLPMLSWKRQSAPASISASCVSILVIFINIFNCTIYMGNALPPKLPEDRQCSTPLRSILAHGGREPGSLDYLKSHNLSMTLPVPRLQQAHMHTIEIQ